MDGWMDVHMYTHIRIYMQIIEGTTHIYKCTNNSKENTDIHICMQMYTSMHTDIYMSPGPPSTQAGRAAPSSIAPVAALGKAPALKARSEGARLQSTWIHLWALRLQ